MAKRNFGVSMNGAEFRKAIAKKRQSVEENVEEVVSRTAKDVRTTLFSNTPIADSFSAIKTIGGRVSDAITVIGGRARAAFTNSPKRPSDAIFKVKKFEASIGSRVPHMKFLEDGTRAHGPKRANFLRFPTKDGIVFAKWVRGIRPMKIFKRTQMLYERIFPKRIREAVKKGLEK